jgi:DNA-binding response OmpR family regulator
MRVLVVEDDPALGIFLQKGLMLEGHEVSWVTDGEAALEQAAADHPDLMVLDLSLPRLDGTEVLERVRPLSPGTSVLVLSGRNKLEERVRCLNLGADDYLLKPFSFHELTARCRAVLRRKERFSDPVLRYGDIEMNLMERTVRRNSVSVELTTKEFALLEFLMRKQGGCCARAELLRDVWQVSADTATNVVDVYINYLRKKLGSAALVGEVEMPVIETVRGQGYRMRTSRMAGLSSKMAQLDIAETA